MLDLWHTDRPYMEREPWHICRVFSPNAVSWARRSQPSARHICCVFSHAYRVQNIYVPLGWFDFRDPGTLRFDARPQVYSSNKWTIMNSYLTRWCLLEYWPRTSETLSYISPGLLWWCQLGNNYDQIWSFCNMFIVPMMSGYDIRLWCMTLTLPINGVCVCLKKLTSLLSRPIKSGTNLTRCDDISTVRHVMTSASSRPIKSGTFFRCFDKLAVIFHAVDSFFSPGQSLHFTVTFFSFRSTK